MNQFLFRVILWMVFIVPINAKAVSYYYCQGNPAVFSSWNTLPQGGGIAPVSFFAGDTFYFLNGQAAILTSQWTLGGGGILFLQPGSEFRLAANLIIESGATLEISDAAVLLADTFEIRGMGNLKMTGGELIFKRLKTTLPQLGGTYQLSGGVVHLAGDGDQVVRGNRSYHVLKFSGNNGIKSFSTAITGSNTLHQLYIDGAIVVDAAARTIGGPATHFTLIHGDYRCGGLGTKPDAGGIYDVRGGCVLFYGESGSWPSVRGGVKYVGVRVSGEGAGPSTANIQLSDSGCFRIDSMATWNMTNTNIGIVGGTGSRVEVYGTFRLHHASGLKGNSFAALRGAEALFLHPSALVEYARSGNQTISPFIYPALSLSGNGGRQAPDTLESGRLLKIKAGISLQTRRVRFSPRGTILYWGDTSFSGFRIGGEADHNADTIIIRMPSDTLLADTHFYARFLKLESGILKIEHALLTLEACPIGQESIRAGEEAGLRLIGEACQGNSLAGSCGRQLWKYIELNCQGDTLKLQDTLVVRGLLHLASGVLSTQGRLQLHSIQDSSYAMLKPGTGSIKGPVEICHRFPAREGWMYLSPPVKTVLQDFHGSWPVQLGANASVYFWDARNSGWKSPVSLTDSIGGGRIIAVWSSLQQGIIDLRLRGYLNDAGYINSGQLAYDSSGQASDFTGPKDGWNLLGNPFMSYLDWATLDFDGDTTINRNYYYFHPGLGQYVSHNGWTGHSSQNGQIAPMQAFFVRLGEAADTLTTVFDFSLNQQAFGTNSFLKNAPPSVRFHMESGNRTPQEVSVYQSEDASKKLDRVRDAFLFSSGRPDFLAIQPENSSIRLTQKCLPLNERSCFFLEAHPGANAGKLFIDGEIPGWTFLYRDSLTGSFSSFPPESIHLGPGQKSRLEICLVQKELGNGEATRPDEVCRMWRGEVLAEASFCGADWNLYDLKGALIRTGKIGETGAERALPSGLYLIRLQKGGLQYSGIIYNQKDN